MRISDYLEELRFKIKMSRQELADEFNSSFSVVYEAERGNRISKKTLRKYSIFFNIPLERLMKFRDNGNINELKEYQDIDYVIKHKKEQERLPENTDFIYQSVPYYSSIENYIANIKENENYLFLRKELESDLNNHAIWTLPYFGEEVNKLFLSTDILTVNSASSIKNGDLIVYQYRNDHKVFFGIRKYFNLNNAQEEILLSSASTNESIYDILLSAKDFKQKFKILGKVIFSFKTYY